MIAKNTSYPHINCPQQADKTSSTLTVNPVPEEEGLPFSVWCRATNIADFRDSDLARFAMYHMFDNSCFFEMCIKECNE